MKELYVFIDNSFLFIQGYKHALKVTKLPPNGNQKPQINYGDLKKFIEQHEDGKIKRISLVGSNLSGKLVSNCQRIGYDIVPLPHFTNFKKGMEEKGVDQKLVWEIAKTIFTNKLPTVEKKIVLCSGDKDFMSIFKDIQTTNWSLSVWVWGNAYSRIYEEAVQSFGEIHKIDIYWKEFIKIVTNIPKSRQQ
jgi:hypothetical protein